MPTAPHQPPHRLANFDYRGFHRYFLTFCTHDRNPHFARAEVVAVVLTQLSTAALECDIAVPAYCFMPDHLHLLAEGTSENADGRRFIVRFKQGTGYASRHLVDRLWQRYGYEQVLRSADATLSVARYILDNPVRARLVVRPQEYPFSGSLTHTLDEVLSAASSWRPRTSG